MNEKEQALLDQTTQILGVDTSQMPLVDIIEKLVKQNEEYKKKQDELISLNLWSARRVHGIHRDFAHKELKRIAGDHPYLEFLKEEIPVG